MSNYKVLPGSPPMTDHLSSGSDHNGSSSAPVMRAVMPTDTVAPASNIDEEGGALYPKNDISQKNTIERFIAALELPEPGLSDQELQTRVPTTHKVRINLDRLKQFGVLTPDFAHSRLAEELRRIKFCTLSKAMGLNDKPINRSNLIMVTSTGPNEGKTFLAVNLAISISMEIDRTVLLVDCDAMRSGITHTFGIESKLGFSDVLSSDLDVADVLLNTDIDNLRILPSGTRIANINEQLASQKMAKLMDQMANRYADRIIIFDTPPVLATFQANILAPLVGQILFVVELGKANQKDLVTALERLEYSKKIGFVLNKNRARSETSNPYYDDYFKI